MPKPVNHNVRSIAAAALVTLSQDLPARAWMKVLPAGTWSARDGRGPFKVGDLKHMQAIVERTKRYAGGVELMVDYDHQAQVAKRLGVRAEAAGWVKALEARADGIYAEIEWTAAAADKIKACEYRYLSPLFAEGKDGNVALLLNVALVNMPAVDLTAIAAHFNFTEENVLMDKIAQALGLDAGASEDAILAAATALATALGAVALAAGLEQTAKPDDITATVTTLVADAGKVSTALGLKADARTDEVVALASELKKGGDPDPREFAPIATVTALQTELAEVKKQLDGDRAEAAVDKAMKAGKLIPAQREWALSLFAKDEAAFTSFVDKAVPLTKAQIDDANPPTPAAKVTALSTEQASIARMLGQSPETYLKTLQAEQETAQ